MSPLVWAGVAVFGGVGAVARFVLDGTIAHRIDVEFPLGTFVVNVSGSFVLGLLTGLGVGGTGLMLGGTATLGSFTTFSTWMLETERLGEDGEGRLMGLNAALSLALGLGAAACGWLIGRGL